MDGEDEKIIKKSKRSKLHDANKQLSRVNSLFIKNDLDGCVDALKTVINKYPKNSRAYFMMGLVFEEKADLVKAYNFYLISSQLMKKNYRIWEKLYELSERLGYWKDRIYYIQVLQRKYNERRYVAEKLEIYRMLGYKYKILECYIELFSFDGVNSSIFSIIRKETKHRNVTSHLCRMIIKYYRNNKEECGVEFLRECIKLQLEVGYLIGTRNLIDEFLIPYYGKNLPNDVKIIYICSMLVENSDDNERDEESNNGEPKARETSDPETAFIDNNCQFYHNNSKANSTVDDKPDIDYTSALNRILTNDKNIYKEIRYVEKDTLKESATLNLIDFLQTKNEKKINYETYLDDLLVDEVFWANFKEYDMIKIMVNLLIEVKNLEKAKSLILKILSKSSDIEEFCFWYLGNICQLEDDPYGAIHHYNNVLEINPSNNDVKKKLYKLYMNIGNIELAKKYEVICSLINMMETLNEDDKRRLRVCPEKAIIFREKFFKSKDLLDKNIHEFLDISTELINEFISNKKIFSNKRKYSSLLTLKDGVFSNMKALPNSSDNTGVPAKRLLEENLNYLSYHGLDLEEWSVLFRDCILGLIHTKNFKKATEILKKCFTLGIFVKNEKIFFQFMFIAISHAVHTNDLILLIFVFKKYIFCYKDFGMTYFFYYLLNFFPEYLEKRPYRQFIGVVRKTLYKSLNKQQDAPSNTSIYKNASIFLYLSTHLPMMLHNTTIRKLNRIEADLSIEEELLKCIININMFMSRTNPNKKGKIKKILEKMKECADKLKGEDRFVVYYNIGRIYHSYNLIAVAEKYYLQVLSTKNKDLKKMALFNLIIIYQNAKNFALLKMLYDKYDP